PRDASDAIEIPAVVGDENHACFTARQRQEDVVSEGLRDTMQLQAFAARELGEHRPRCFPSPSRGCDDSPPAREHPQHMAPQLTEIGGRVRTRDELLRDDGTQELERCEEEVESLEFGVDRGLAECADEEIGIEYVLSRRAGAHPAVSS